MQNLDVHTYREVFRNRRMAVMILLGFSSGLPLALTSGTLQAWLTVEGIDLRTIGLFSLVGIPYTLKFLWSPLIDRFSLPLMGRRRGWILATQAALMIGIVTMGLSSPSAPYLLGLLALIVAFTAASHDIVIDAYRTDILQEHERGVGAAVFVLGYRIAMLVSGALALIMSGYIGWQKTYLVMAACVAIGLAGTLWGEEPENVGAPKNLSEAVSGPIRNFFSRRKALLLLLLIILYKLGDAYAGSLTTAFLIRGMTFSPAEVGTVNKGFGLFSLIVGAAVGGTLMLRLGLFRSLLAFGILQAISNLSFTVLAWVGKSYWLMIVAIAFENLSGGMGSAAFVSLLMALCDHRYSATQYALLSSLAALGRTFVAPTSGFLAESIGWAGFFLGTALTALPGLAMLWLLRYEIIGLSADARQPR